MKLQGKILSRSNASLGCFPHQLERMAEAINPLKAVHVAAAAAAAARCTNRRPLKIPSGVVLFWTFRRPLSGALTKRILSACFWREGRGAHIFHVPWPGGCPHENRTPCPDLEARNTLSSARRRVSLNNGRIPERTDGRHCDPQFLLPP